MADPHINTNVTWPIGPEWTSYGVVSLSRGAPTTHCNPADLHVATSETRNYSDDEALYSGVQTVPHAWARVRFFAITIWMTREFRFEARVLEFPYAVAPANGLEALNEPFRPPYSFDS